MRKACKRRVRAVNVPITAPLRDEIRMGLHAAYATLASSEPTHDALLQLSEIVDMIGLACNRRGKFAQEVVQLNSAARAIAQLRNMKPGVALSLYETLPILNAVNLIDGMLTKFTVVELFQSLQAARALAQQRA